MVVAEEMKCSIQRGAFNEFNVVLYREKIINVRKNVMSFKNFNNRRF